MLIGHVSERCTPNPIKTSVFSRQSGLSEVLFFFSSLVSVRMRSTRVALLADLITFPALVAKRTQRYGVGRRSLTGCLEYRTKLQKRQRQPSACRSRAFYMEDPAQLMSCRTGREAMKASRRCRGGNLRATH